jgi:hypothetical protein
MIAATVLAVFFIPVFYVVMQRLSELRRPAPAPRVEAIHLAEEPSDLLPR